VRVSSGMRTQVPKSNKQNIQTSEDKRENVPRGTCLMSAYPCRLDLDYEIHHYNEHITIIHVSVKHNSAQFSPELPFARYDIQGLNSERTLSSFQRYFSFVDDLKKILSFGVGVSGCFSFFTQSLVAFYVVNS